MNGPDFESFVVGRGDQGLSITGETDTTYRSGVGSERCGLALTERKKQRNYDPHQDQFPDQLSSTHGLNLFYTWPSWPRTCITKLNQNVIVFVT